MKTPIVFLIFNRPELTAKVFEVIRQAQPPMLFVIADGPRPDRANEAQKCEQTRAVIEGVDWNCQVLTNYSDVNLGCAKRVSSGLNWVFDQVESAIILEDDCLAHPTFFRYCEELLDYYQQEERVMSIAGTNFQFGQKQTEYSYYYSGFHDCWGWATWRRAWQYFDFEMKHWPELRDGEFLTQKLPHKRAVKFWKQEFQDTYEGKINSWFYRWLLSCWVEEGLGIRPNVNLVSNLGFSLTDSSNTIAQAENIPFANMEIEAMQFPLKHPPEIIEDKQADQITQDHRYTRSFLAKLRHKLKRIISS
ncbi:glycosyltransferase family 2 protein [Capilliphycus salinus ALCB114379]|uniref:glycosyltransferase family 2 protein n=1 Tax=Capilliphycus salinus TaxID=2768948 RepID=UPI0039A5BE56